MEELKEGWRRVKLNEIINFNPKETLKKNTVAKYIEMANLQCFSRNILGYEEKEYKGGTKFRNGDTLLARITPCLENGKTAYINCLEKNEVAFGSTEYIILREKENISDKKFIYYLAISNEFRELAIKSMTGTSGRQRVQTDMLINSEINLPPLETQEKIASILSALDDKIEINNEMNKTLEEMAQTLFKRWFIDFDFPNENGEPYRSSGGKMLDSELGEIPEGWRIGSLEEIVNISSGKRPKVKKEKDKLHKIPIIGANGVMSYTNEFMYNEKLLTIGRVGTLGVVQKYYDKIWPSDNSLVIKSDYLEMIYFILKNVDYKSLNRGSTQPLITQTDMKNLKIIIGETELILEFCKIIFKLFDFQRKNQQEINSLTEIRDTLLPKLMSGEVEV